jgi:hypothetical protein
MDLPQLNSPLKHGYQVVILNYRLAIKEARNDLHIILPDDASPEQNLFCLQRLFELRSAFLRTVHLL